MKRIGFIGVGVMGRWMVRNLMQKGFEVSIYTRTKGLFGATILKPACRIKTRSSPL